MTNKSYHNCNLNIGHYLSELEWNKIADLYERMPGWIGYTNGVPYWFGQEDYDRFITASVEPSGLSFYAQLNNSDWNAWIERFKSEATMVLGYEVGEPEDGFMFTHRQQAFPVPEDKSRN
ncbi:type 2 periplasmic-binding domain-containing protein [Paenibacillus tianjinensis]|uniref:Uncharacterized protein n=1 Tax=Paenibacillus tianjinensis TaxID=2810347 RepID=A0ABX7LBG4_9BACL|nr:hypothetical protein [Paenibacillus tianjinensis]QSF44374.1 hypothetical protein JRJ22_24705 [Paenibacillus tianjinensis]